MKYMCIRLRRTLLHCMHKYQKGLQYIVHLSSGHSNAQPAGENIFLLTLRTENIIHLPSSQKALAKHVPYTKPPPKKSTHWLHSFISLSPSRHVYAIRLDSTIPLPFRQNALTTQSDLASPRQENGYSKISLPLRHMVTGYTVIYPLNPREDNSHTVNFTSTQTNLTSSTVPLSLQSWQNPLATQSISLPSRKYTWSYLVPTTLSNFYSIKTNNCCTVLFPFHPDSAVIP